MDRAADFRISNDRVDSGDLSVRWILARNSESFCRAPSEGEKIAGWIDSDADRFFAHVYHLVRRLRHCSHGRSVSYARPAFLDLGRDIFLA